MSRRLWCLISLGLLMAFRGQFCRILPASQVALAALFGGWGLWQRNQILSHDYLFGTGWNSTARFHIWQICRILPASQVALAALFGGWGLWQRNQILSHDYLFGTGWNSTARFHVW